MQTGRQFIYGRASLIQQISILTDTKQSTHQIYVGQQGRVGEGSSQVHSTPTLGPVLKPLSETPWVLLPAVPVADWLEIFCIRWQVIIITEQEIITIWEIKYSVHQIMACRQEYKSHLRNSTIVCWMKWTNAGRWSGSVVKREARRRSVADTVSMSFWSGMLAPPLTWQRILSH